MSTQDDDKTNQNNITFKDNPSILNHVSIFSRINGEEEEEDQAVKEFRQLTTYKKDKHDTIQNFVSSMRRLEDMGIFKSVGSDTKGTIYYMVFGYKYPTNPAERNQANKDVIYLLNFISERYNFSFIYFYTNLNKMSKEPAATLRNMYSRLKPENKRRLQGLHLIHASCMVKVRTKFMKCCGGGRMNFLNKVHFFSTLAGYLTVIKGESSLIQRVIGSLPHEIHQIYLREQDAQKARAQSKTRKTANYAKADEMNRALLQGCAKEVIERGDEQYQNFDIENAVQTTDIIGKHIYQFKRRENDLIPEIFILLVTFFEVNPHLFKTDAIFRAAASMDKVDELQIHLQMGNYYILTKMINEPHSVANFFKKILKCMGEPLCTFKLYSRFRDLSDVKIEQRAEKLKEICQYLPIVNKHTFVYIIRFLHKVIEKHEVNKMNLHNLAIVITPNLFRPFELTANDLIFAGHLVESFKLMIQHYEYIFELDDQDSYGSSNTSNDKK